jgi:hypothetical protein
MISMNELDNAFSESGNDPLGLDDVFAETPPKPKAASDITQYLKERGYWLHECHPVGHHIYPRGCVRIEYHDDVIRYADFDQLAEMEAARQRGFIDELMAQVEGIGCAGPVRVGKPPIDAKGNLIVEQSKGDYGLLKAECEWIESHDDVFVEYAGVDENWPTGCWVITSKGEDQHLDDTQLKYVAHEILGMPHSSNGKKSRVKVTTLKDTGAALMFEDDFQLIPDSMLEPNDLESAFGDDPQAILSMELDDALGILDDPIPF